MSRITKEIAREVAEKLTAKKLKEIQNLDLKQKTILHEFITEKIPKDVMSVYLVRPNYFKTYSSFSVCGNGFDYKHLSTLNYLPFFGGSFEPSQEQAKKLNEVLNEKDNLKVKYFKLVKEIETLLYSLRTYSKVNLEFPEATPFLPENICNKLMVNISDIRSELK
jgi:hypothetical protein